MCRFWSLRMCSAAVTQHFAHLWEMREVEGAWHLGQTVTSRSTCVSGTESVQASILCYRSLSSTVVLRNYISFRDDSVFVTAFQNAISICSNTRSISEQSEFVSATAPVVFGSIRGRWPVSAPVAMLCCGNSNTCIRSMLCCVCDDTTGE
jgi:hypothetical protein